jgi:hypothetical protein
MVFFIANARAIVALDSLVDAFDVGGAGSVRIYDDNGGGVPADADASLGASVLLAQLTMQATGFGASVDLNPGARATANLPIEDTSANNTGTATFWRGFTNGGTSLMQGSATATGMGGDMQINTVSIQASALVSVTSWTITFPES